MKDSGVIAKVLPDSIAEELGITAGDQLLSVNGQPIRDIIDLSFALSDEYVELLIIKSNGEHELLEIEKDFDDDIGLEFESAVFDGVRPCANKCIFCFVDQMPPDMRQSLYIKDDDYRLSFLYGNFITLTNLTRSDMQRIKQLHLSPLYISVHTTDSSLRQKMLGNKKAGALMEQMKELVAIGTQMHCQIVLCPGINDGAALEKTFNDLYAMHPHVLSLAVVPVGLTAFRNDCYDLNGFTVQQATNIIEQVAQWQKKCRNAIGTSFIYLSDEFYISASYPIPDYDEYDDFPQLENGVGIVRNFLSEWHDFDEAPVDYQTPHVIDIVCGISAAQILQPLIAEFIMPNMTVRLVPVINTFFGSTITVTGLLTGDDIINALKSEPNGRTGVIIPGVALRKGENVFLDGKTVDDLADSIDVPIRIAHSGTELRLLLQNWR